MCAKAGIRAHESGSVAFPGFRPVAYRHNPYITRLPLRGQHRHGVLRHAPVSRLTAAENLENPALRHLARLFPLLASSGKQNYSENPIEPQPETAFVE